MLAQECLFGGDAHEFPDDWVFGGADGEHPGSDQRFTPTSYTYYDDHLNPIHVTSAPLCDDEALDEFTKVASWNRTWKPTYISKTFRNDDDRLETLMMPWYYVRADDTVYPKD